MTCQFNLRHMISVHVSALFKTFHCGGNQYVLLLYRTHFKRLFITKSIKEKMQTYNGVQTVAVCRKYPSLAKNQDGECSSPDTADHPSDTPRLLLLPYLVRQIFGHDRRKHTTIEKQENRQSTEDKTRKKQRAEDINQKLTSLFLGDPCRTACSAGLTTRSSVAGGL